MLRTPADSRELLEAGGYTWNAEREVWVDPKTERELAGPIAWTMPLEQLTKWLKAGEGRGSF